MSEFPMDDDYESEFAAPPYRIVGRRHIDDHVITAIEIDGVLDYSVVHINDLLVEGVMNRERELLRELRRISI